MTKDYFGTVLERLINLPQLINLSCVGGRITLYVLYLQNTQYIYIYTQIYTYMGYFFFVIQNKYIIHHTLGIIWPRENSIVEVIRTFERGKWHIYIYIFCSLDPTCWAHIIKFMYRITVRLEQFCDCVRHSRNLLIIFYGPHNQQYYYIFCVPTTLHF